MDMDVIDHLRVAAIFYGSKEKSALDSSYIIPLDVFVYGGGSL